MDVNTGHLINTVSCTGEEVEKLKKAGYIAVPKEHQPEAEKELAGKKETVLDLKCGNELSNWAACKREEKKELRRMAKNSRRRNRGVKDERKRGSHRRRY